MMARTTAAKAPSIAAILPAPRADVVQVQMRDVRPPRRKRVGEVFSTEDTDTAPPRKMLRVASDAQLERSLGPVLFSALSGIRAAFHRLTVGMGMASASYEARVNTGGFNPNRSAGDALADRWLTWGRLCTDERLDVAAIIEVVVNGQATAAVDKMRRKREGWSMKQVRRGAELWLSQRAKLSGGMRKGPR